MRTQACPLSAANTRWGQFRAYEEGIPRANWNLLAARANLEPVVRQSELIAGCTGSGKGIYAKQRIVEALAAQRPVLIISPLAEYEALVRTLGGTECVVLPDGQIRLRKGYSKLFLLTWDGLASNKPRFSATLKQLGFQKPDLREILLVADEIHAYARDPWFLEMLTELMPHECATTMLIAQDAREAIVPALVARAGSLRIFRQYDFVARQLLDRDTAVEAVQLETGQSIVRKVAFLTAATDTAGLRFVDPAVVRAVLANTATRIFMKVVAPESNSPQEE